MVIKPSNDIIDECDGVVRSGATKSRTAWVFEPGVTKLYEPVLIAFIRLAMFSRPCCVIFRLSRAPTASTLQFQPSPKLPFRPNVPRMTSFERSLPAGMSPNR